MSARRAAIASGLCETALITHGESGRSGVGRTRNVVAPTSLAGQFEHPYGPLGTPTLFMIPVLRYMKTYGFSHEQLAMVSVVQREWAGKNAREIPGQPALAAVPRTPVTVEDVNCGRACFETRPPGAPQHEVSLSYLE
jgi:acetyl-CoA acetyltransferase